MGTHRRQAVGKNPSRQQPPYPTVFYKRHSDVYCVWKGLTVAQKTRKQHEKRKKNNYTFCSSFYDFNDADIIILMIFWNYIGLS